MQNVFTLSTLLILSSFLASVLGHGWVSKVEVGGKTYTGLAPWDRHKNNSPIRQISTVNPVTNPNGHEITCGWNAKPAPLTVPAPAGGKITFTWRQSSGHWGHKTGPLLTYIAKCDGKCENFDPKNANWYKISETGLKPGGHAVWYQEDIENGKSYTTTIPAGIPNGDYIIRHEIIALHFATRMNGAQFYPSCTQVTITGGSDFSSLSAATSSPSGHFPGAYHSTDKGIYVPKVYSLKTYDFPGPAVAVWNGKGSGNPPPTKPTSASAKPSSTPRSCDNKRDDRMVKVRKEDHVDYAAHQRRAAAALGHDSQ